MHSHVALRRHDHRTAGPGRRLAGRVAMVTAARPPVRLWAGRGTAPLGPGRVPEESYRDYVFRQGIWP